MFDPDAAPMGDLAGEGNRDLPEDDDDEMLYHPVKRFVSPGP